MTLHARTTAVRTALFIIVFTVGAITFWAAPVSAATTFAVDSASDAVDAETGDGLCATADGACTLRAAIMEANATSGEVTVLLPSGEYVLTIPGGNEDDGLTGDLDITGSIVISGVEVGLSVVNGGNLDRVFHVRAGGELTLERLTVSGGLPPTGHLGGGIYNKGILVLDTVAVINNRTRVGSTASIILIDSEVEDRDILGTLTRGGDGGGIANYGTTTIADSTVIGNKTGNGGMKADGRIGGGGGFGGGIANYGTMTITTSTVSGNAAGSGAESRALTRRSLPPQGGSGGHGGGFFNNGSLTITDSTVSGNTAGAGGLGGPGGPGGNGGGIATHGTAIITNSTVSGNTAGQGGATYDGDDGCSGSFCVDSIDGSVGGTGGNGGHGGGIYNTASLTLAHVTIAQNAVGAGAAGGVGGDPGCETDLDGNVVECGAPGPDGEPGSNGTGGGLRTAGSDAFAGNTVFAGNAADIGPDVAGDVSSADGNLVGDAAGSTGWTTGDLLDVPAGIGPLADNGGPTRTHELLPGSAAIDAVALTGCTIAADQRGVARPQGPACDSGAFEFADAVPPVLSLPDDIVEEATGPHGVVIPFAVTALDAVDPTPVVVCAPASGSEFPLGSTTVDCTATDASGNTSSGSFTVTVVDTTPPVISVPSNAEIEGNEQGGATVDIPGATALDLVDDLPTVECAPLGQTFVPIGTITVDCTATDASGNSSSGSFTVTVVDTTPPALTVPDDITVEATETGGAVVTFDVTAIDIVDPAPVVTCDAASGSEFPIGETTVTCEAADLSGNSVSADFDVTVQDSVVTIEEVIAAVNAAVADGTLVGHGPGKSGNGRLKAWRNMLNEAADLVSTDNVAEACGHLRDAYLRADGIHPPPDFVDGSGREAIAALIAEAMADLGCDEPHAPGGGNGGGPGGPPAGGPTAAGDDPGKSGKSKGRNR